MTRSGWREQAVSQATWTDPQKKFFAAVQITRHTGAAVEWVQRDHHEPRPISPPRRAIHNATRCFSASSKKFGMINGLVGRRV
jgi:hypothetical protein